MPVSIRAIHDSFAPDSTVKTSDERQGGNCQPAEFQPEVRDDAWRGAERAFPTQDFGKSLTGSGIVHKFRNAKIGVFVGPHRTRHRPHNYLRRVSESPVESLFRFSRQYGPGAIYVFISRVGFVHYRRDVGPELEIRTEV